MIGFSTEGIMLFVLLFGCAEPPTSYDGASATETGIEEATVDTGGEYEGEDADSACAVCVSVDFTATITTAERAEGSNSFVTAVVDAPGATFTVSRFTLAEMPAEEGAGSIVATGVTPSTVSLKPGFYCVEFTHTSETWTPYVSDRTCFHAADTHTINGELCIQLRSDWICEDMWGEGTPDTYYTTRDIEMGSCQTELYGITWGSQPAVFNGHYATFSLGEYTAVGAVDENGTSIEWFVDYEMDYWTSRAMMY
jgi:hypothetical protein